MKKRRENETKPYKATKVTVIRKVCCPKVMRTSAANMKITTWPKEYIMRVIISPAITF